MRMYYLCTPFGYGGLYHTCACALTWKPVHT